MLVTVCRVRSQLAQRLQYRVARNVLFSSVPSDDLAKSERFNKIVDVYSPRVVSNIELKAGDKVILCRCWKSTKFPLCDGAHGKHNKETGDNLGPVVVTVAPMPQV